VCWFFLLIISLQVTGVGGIVLLLWGDAAKGVLVHQGIGTLGEAPVLGNSLFSDALPYSDDVNVNIGGLVSVSGLGQVGTGTLRGTGFGPGWTGSNEVQGWRGSDEGIGPEGRRVRRGGREAGTGHEGGRRVELGGKGPS